jgi:hypothetical protein
MIRFIPAIIAISVACYFAGNAAYQMNGAASAINSYDAVAAAVQGPADTPAEKPAEPRPDPNARVIERPAEPVYKSLIQCLGDLDDLLDTIHDPATFAAARPRLLARAREQADYAKAYPGGGMARLSRSAAKELQIAMNRHAGSLERAYRAVPAVKPFFENELAKILGAK